MTIATAPESFRTDFHIGRERSILQRISEPHVSFAVWRRSLADETSQALVAWIERGAIDVDRILASNSSIQSAIPEMRLLPDSTRILADVEELLLQFREISSAKRVRVAIGIKRSDACRKFHTDNVRIRLITTYVGPGTEWVPNPGVDRVALQHPPDCSCDANRTIVRDMRSVRRANTGDVLLLKGELYGGALGAVHRSPPIEQRRLQRLVLAMTTAA